jgi:hypothetical protein
MLSDVLASFAEIRRIILEEEGYLLAVVRAKGTEYLAEVVPGDVPAPDWPDVEGLEAPLASRAVEDVRIGVYALGGRTSLAERIAGGPMTEEEALRLGAGLVPVLSRLSAANRVLGYIGPESVLLEDGRPVLLAGSRRCPSGPFTAPEASGGRAADPRSAVFALGTLIFRCIAGSDEKEQQIRAWRELTPSTRSLLEEVVGERPEDRLPSVSIFGREIAARLDGGEAPPPRRAETAASPKEGEASAEDAARRDPAAPAPESFVRQEAYTPRRRRRRRLSLGMVITVAAVLAAAAAAVLLVPEWLAEDDGGPAAPPPDTAETVETADSVAAPVDSSPPQTAEAVTDSSELGAPPGPSVIWVSNRTPDAGAEVDYRTGVLSDYSHVYPFSGGRARESSLLLLRRDDPSAGPGSQLAYADAEAILRLDTTLTLAPVDLTVMVGADLRYDGINPGILRQPSDPAGTLYVDVVNQGLEFPPDGTTPGHVWLADRIDGRSITVPDHGEWMLSVVDTRWGDRNGNDELPLAWRPESTIFLYREGSEHCRAAEAAIREAVQPFARAVSGPPEGIIVPDIWILAGGGETAEST